MFCILRNCPSRYRIFAYLGDLSFTCSCCFVLSTSYLYAFFLYSSPSQFSFVYAWYIYFLPGLFFSLFFFLCLGYIIFLYLFCFFLLFCFSILREVPLPLLLVHGPSPHNLHRCGLACVSATLVDCACLLRIFYLHLVLFLFQKFLYSVYALLALSPCSLEKILLACFFRTTNFISPAC